MKMVEFTLETLGDMTYRQVGREIIEKDNGKNSYPSRRQAKKQNQLVLVISGVLTAILLVTAGLYSVIWCQSYGPTNQWIVSNKNSKQITYSTQKQGYKRTT